MKSRQTKDGVGMMIKSPQNRKEVMQGAAMKYIGILGSPERRHGFDTGCMVGNGCK